MYGFSSIEFHIISPSETMTAGELCYMCSSLQVLFEFGVFLHSFKRIKHRSIANVLFCEILNKLTFDNGVALQVNRDSRLNLVLYSQKYQVLTCICPY